MTTEKRAYAVVYENGLVFAEGYSEALSVFQPGDQVEIRPRVAPGEHAMSAADERAAAAGLLYRLLPYLYSSNDSPDKPGKQGICNGCGFNAVMDEHGQWNCDHTPEDTGCAVADAERFVRAVDAEQIAAEALAAAPEGQEVVRGVDLIAEERRRQIENEGWTQAHDAEHCREEIALAAACYVLPGALRYIQSGRPHFWPDTWNLEWWKPAPLTLKNFGGYDVPTAAGRVRELVKAGALVAAEIDRLLTLPQDGPCDPPDWDLPPAARPSAAPRAAPLNASPMAVMAQALRDKAAAESAAAPRQPEGPHKPSCKIPGCLGCVLPDPKSEPEGQDLSEEEIAAIEKEPWVGASTVIAQMPFECMTCGAQFATVPSGYKCPNDGSGLTLGFWRVPIAPSQKLAKRLLAAVKRHRAQPADAAPLVALRRALEAARKCACMCDDCDGRFTAALAAAPRDERDVAVVDGQLVARSDAGAKAIDAYVAAAALGAPPKLRPRDPLFSQVPEGLGQALQIATDAFAEAPLGAPDARPDRVLHALAVAYDSPHRDYCDKGDETPDCGACRAESNMWTEFRLLVFGSPDPHAASDALAFLEKLSPVSAASLEVEALDERLCELLECMGEANSHSIKLTRGEVQIIRAVLRKAGRHE